MKKGTGTALKAATSKPPMQYKTEESFGCTTYLRMNWGWDGNYDDGRYFYSGSWPANNHDFQWRKELLYNFAKK